MSTLRVKFHSLLLSKFKLKKIRNFGILKNEMQYTIEKIFIKITKIVIIVCIQFL